MVLGKANFRKDSAGTPEILKDPVNLQKIALLGSFIAVKHGSLYEELERRGYDVKPA